MPFITGLSDGTIVYLLLDFGLRRYIDESTSFINCAVYVAFVLFIPFGIVGAWKMKSFQIKQGWEQLVRMFK